MNKIVIISFSDFTAEPRVIRTIESLKSKYKIVVFSTGKNYSGIESIDIGDLNNDYFFLPKGNRFIKKIKNWANLIYTMEVPGSNKYYFSQYWNFGRREILKLLKAQKADLYIGHGIYSVPLLSELSRESKTIFNAHEYYSREFEENASWLKYTQPYYNFILKKYLEAIHLMFCVCDTIQAEYQKDFHINSVVVTNARDYENIEPSNVEQNGHIKLVHHGAALKGRNLEKTIEVINYLPHNYELHLILMPSDLNYYNELLDKYKDQPRIFFHAPVSVNEIPNFINRYDVGIYILPPTNYNNLVALPNKFFDFIQARLCLAISPNIEMKNFIEKYNLGVVGAGFESKDIANEIKKLSITDVMRYKNNCHESAMKLSSDNNRIIIQNAVKELLMN